MTYTIEQQKKDAWSFLNCQVKAQNLARKRFKSIKRTYNLDVMDKANVLMSGLIQWCKLLDMEYYRVDWEGNEHCKSNWDMVYFDYKGYRFFELLPKGRDSI